MHLDVVATLTEVVQCEFGGAPLRAKANCPISRSLKVKSSMRAKLKPQAEVEERRKRDSFRQGVEERQRRGREQSFSTE